MIFFFFLPVLSYKFIRKRTFAQISVMKKILLIGAGRSSSSLISYLLSHAANEGWILTVADMSIRSAEEKTAGHASARAIQLDINDTVATTTEIENSDLVLSMLPAHMHIQIARECVRMRKHLVTASYVSKEMTELHESAMRADVILLNECGLDPGIDHMSAMEMIDEIREKGGQLEVFKSFTGGLVAPASNDNPWGYKFSWNPRNVIIAGQGTARYMENGSYKYIPYHRLFAQSEKVHVDGHGNFDGYANRDSLSYIKTYGIESVNTMLRGTLRQEGFCRAWNVFVQLGLTDDSYFLEGTEDLSYAKLIDAFLPGREGKVSLRKRLSELMNYPENDPALDLVEWTGILDEKKIGLSKVSPAQILQSLLEVKWKLGDDDKDMIVMQHLFRFTLNNKMHSLTSSLVVEGENSFHTAMARTVGLPAAISTRLILNGIIRERGVRIPVSREIYKPVLTELKELGIAFRNQVSVDS